MLKLHVYCTIIFTVTVIFNLLCPSHLHESVTDLNNISCNTSVRIFGLNFSRLVNNEKSPFSEGHHMDVMQNVLMAHAHCMGPGQEQGSGPGPGPGPGLGLGLGMMGFLSHYVLYILHRNRELKFSIVSIPVPGSVPVPVLSWSWACTECMSCTCVVRRGIT